MRIDIEPVWRFRKEDDDEPLPVMLDLLDDIRTTGKISAAARQAGISYRHAWNLIEKWSVFFNAPLVVRQRGRGTTLTPFGEKLVWAWQRLRARLKPQLDNLAQELETEINQFLPRGPVRLRVHASHGFAVAKLREILTRTGDVGVDLRYVSNQTSLVSLAREECDLAGLHLPRGALRAHALAAWQEWLSADRHVVVGFATRDMGLMVKPGNPRGITSVASLANAEVRFVNRDPASGTGQLFDQILAQDGLDPASINGYSQFEFTHAAVAAYVASGMADACFGVEAAARQFGLEFVHLVTEDYVFVCDRALLATEAMDRVLEVIRSPEFHAAVAELPGYSPDDAGVVKPVREILASAA